METTATKKLSRKQVRETSVGKSVSAWVILRNDGRHVATVQSAYLDSGSVMVDVWGPHSLVHQGKAGGGGYDKFTAALAGAKIDGNDIYDHSTGNYNDTNPKYGDLNSLYQRYKRNPLNEGKWNEEARKLGASFSNWNSDKKIYDSLYYISGLERLTALGYKVIQAI